MGPWPLLSLKAHPIGSTHLLTQANKQEAGQIAEGHGALEAAACRCEMELPLEQSLKLPSWPTAPRWGQPHPPSLLPDQLCACSLLWLQNFLLWPLLAAPETSQREAAGMVRGPERATLHHTEDAIEGKAHPDLRDAKVGETSGLEWRGVQKVPGDPPFPAAAVLAQTSHFSIPFSFPLTSPLTIVHTQTSMAASQVAQG